VAAVYLPSSLVVTVLCDVCRMVTVKAWRKWLFSSSAGNDFARTWRKLVFCWNWFENENGWKMSRRVLYRVRIAWQCLCFHLFLFNVTLLVVTSTVVCNTYCRVIRFCDKNFACAFDIGFEIGENFVSSSQQFPYLHFYERQWKTFSCTNSAFVAFIC